ncbi:hypothetical protein ACFY9F_36055 [Streptomyces sp. NPDC012421]|uniref:hypothetical protein n=1 Tax=Streptomyces sp. NPDC012421 TaxID=3364832 RepID=UPI0036E0C822
MQDMLVLADAITDTNALGVRFRDLLTGTVMSVMVALSVIVTWNKTKSMLAAGAALLGAVALWYAVMNAVAFRDSVGETIRPGGGAPAVTEGRGPAVVRGVEPADVSQRGGEVL